MEAKIKITILIIVTAFFSILVFLLLNTPGNNNLASDRLFLLLAMFTVLISSTIALIFAPIKEFGNDAKEKENAFKRLTINFSIIVALILIIVVAHLKLLSAEIFYLLFGAALSGLGVKLFNDTKSLP